MNKKHSILIDSNNLKKGMVLSEDIYMGDLMLLPEGTSLNETLILKLQQVFPYGKIPVINLSSLDDIASSSNINNSSLEYETNLHLDGVMKTNIPNERLKKIEIIFENLTNKMDKLIYSVKRNSGPKLEDVREISKHILNEVTDYTYALKTISNETEIDKTLVKHSVNVAVLSSMLGGWLKLPKKQINLLTYASLLHDIGKTKISNKILNKSTKLTKDEFNTFKKHPVIAYEILKKIPYLDSSVKIAVLMHHERIDGSGYPLSLKEKNITSFARILAISDMYDTLTSNHSNTKQVSAFKALDIMQKDNINKLDPIYLTTFLERVGDYFTGEYVQLNNGKIGKIIKMNMDNIAKPLISIGENFIDLQNEAELEIENLCMK